MAVISVKLDDVRGLEPVPMGWYQVRIMKSTYTTGKLKVDGTERKPFVNVWADIVDGDHKGEKLFFDIVFTEKSLMYSKAFLEALGYPTDKVVDMDSDSWVGMQLMVHVKHKFGADGKPRAECDDYQSLEKAGKEKAFDDEIPF